MSDDPPDGVDNILYRFLFELAESRKRAMKYVPKYSEAEYAALGGMCFLDDDNGGEERVVGQVNVADGLPGRPGLVLMGSCRWRIPSTRPTSGRWWTVMMRLTPSPCRVGSSVAPALFCLSTCLNAGGSLLIL